MSRARGAAAWVVALVLGLTALAGMAAPAAVAAAPADPSSWCTGSGHARLAHPAVQSSDRQANGAAIVPHAAADGGYTPVLLVHGFNGDSSIWRKPVVLNELADEKTTWRTSLQGALQALPGAAVFTYDYGPKSTDWITQDGISDGLGTDIDCLARASGGKVIVVAHSMGGLALRQALSEGGSARAKEIAEVVTLGTPNTGSRIAAIAQGVEAGKPIPRSDADLFSVLSLLHAGCTGGGGWDPLCGAVGFFWTNTGTPASQALAEGSSKMADLAPWPPGVHVYALHGDISIELSRAATWFGVTLGGANDTPIGDTLVMPDSARGGARDSNSVACGYTLDATVNEADVVLETVRGPSVPGAQSVTAIGGSACFHGNLPSSVALATEVVGDVSTHLRALHPSFDPLTMAVPAMCEQAGGRMVHGTFSAVGTADSADRATPLDWLFTKKGIATSSTRADSITLTDSQRPDAGNGQVAAATAVGCDAGGIDSWPDHLVFSRTDGSLLASFDLATLSDAEHADFTSVSLHGNAATATWFSDGPDSVDAADAYLGNTATFTFNGSSTLAMTGLTHFLPGLQGSIGFGRIGQLTDSMTLAQIRTALESHISLTAPNPSCSGVQFGSAPIGDPLDQADSLVFALAASHGATGAVDFIDLGKAYNGFVSHPDLLTLLPRTASGIGIGSTEAQVRAAYPSATESAQPNGAPGRQYVAVSGAEGLRFVVDTSGTVTDIVTGKASAVGNDDGCG